MECIECGSAADSERSDRTAQGYCRCRYRAYEELRFLLRSRSQTNQYVSADYRRFQFLRGNSTLMRLSQAV
jgi:hypothetical protein